MKIIIISKLNLKLHLIKIKINRQLMNKIKKKQQHNRLPYKLKVNVNKNLFLNKLNIMLKRQLTKIKADLNN